jgi:hypothetical protein
VGKTSRALFYKGNVKLVEKKGDDEPDEKIESSLNLEVIAGNVNIVRIYNYDEEKKLLTVKADFKVNFFYILEILTQIMEGSRSILHLLEKA